LPWDIQLKGGGGGEYSSDSHKDAFEKIFLNFYTAIKERRRIPRGSRSDSEIREIN
jgi:hypothetical protein